MKHCDTCSKDYTDDMHFCPSCGAKLTVPVKFIDIDDDMTGGQQAESSEKRCPNCGKICDDGIAFCPQCGTDMKMNDVLPAANDEVSDALPTDAEKIATMQNVSERNRKWSFRKKYVSGNKICSDVMADGTYLHVEQYKQVFWLFKIGRTSYDLEVSELTAVQKAKKFSGVSLMEVLLGIWAICSGHYSGLILLLWGLSALRGDCLVLSYPRASVEIPDRQRIHSGNRDMASFVEFIRQHNPRCIKSTE